MKTAISIPDTLFRNAKKTAEKLGLSRSKLFSTAVKEFIENHTHADITKKLDSIYSKETDKLDDKLLKMQMISIKTKEDW